ncbi:MAG: NAD(P)-binding protein, partial [Planctomycetota bacterium]
MAGLSAARKLIASGQKVTIIDKGRGVGGRMATKHLEECGSFDHGAACFEASDHRFLRYLQSWRAQGLVERWPAQAERHVLLCAGETTPVTRQLELYAARPQMNSICKHLAQGLEIRKQTRVSCIRAAQGQWELLDETGQGMG